MTGQTLCCEDPGPMCWEGNPYQVWDVVGPRVSRRYEEGLDLRIRSA